jgi:uncharacterized SAM-binding protein YcdF (DUF218 family)
MYWFLNGFLQPVLLLFLLTAIMLTTLWRRCREIRGRLLWAIVAFVGLAGLCTRAVAYLALGSLEWLTPPDPNRPEAVQAIVVLSGSVLPPDKLLPNGELGGNTLHRCLHAARLYRRGPACLVVVSGGPLAAQLMQDFLVEHGVAKSDVVTEDRSTSTYESAVETRALLGERGIDNIVLVSDAAHLPRARRCFSAQGFAVTPSGCHYRATSFSWSLFDFLPSPGAAREVQEAMHEWLGLGWYWLHGRT